ncbi:hypothetical protein LCGC14_2221780 [marine sediment metagenome]|uniref:Uncharacterized protein n=1 Tax=marine sediment metagenome TaxID=412755 RepID=A0A0F9DAW5_9ZZZZ
MKIKDVYKLKRFGTYWVEIDCDDREKIKTFQKTLEKAVRFRFIKFVLVPMGAVKLIKQSEGGNQNDRNKTS